MADGQVDVVYRAQHGAHVGVVTVSPQQPTRYVFIHGPEHPDSRWHYDFHHRRGVIVSEPDRELAETLDAMDITEPYTAGARGGTHVHVFSPDATRLSFTYNDHVMHEKMWRSISVMLVLLYHCMRLTCRNSIPVNMMGVISVFWLARQRLNHWREAIKFLEPMKRVGLATKAI